MAANSLDAARQVKHRAWTVWPHTRSVYRRTIDLGYRTQSAIRPYHFDLDRHRDAYGDVPRMYFLHRSAPDRPQRSKTVRQRIFCFWTGDNALTPGRKRGLQALRSSQPDTEVVLVTARTLKDWILPDHPLHVCYESLSLVHRSDYLRAYFMAYFGGGYTDIKRPTGNWLQRFEMFRDPTVWLAGYAEKSSRSCGGDDHTKLGQDIHRNYGRLVSISAFIMRSGTPFACEWLQEVERRLDYYQEDLLQHPGGTWGDEPGYPLRWIEIGSDVYHPLQLKCLEHVRRSQALLPVLEGHR